MNYYLAIDIGASSGRHIVGWVQDGEIRTSEVYRFPNGMEEIGGELVWDLETLVGHVKTGIEEALKKYPEIVSMSVDTWGVDYVLMNGEKEILPCYAYRAFAIFVGEPLRPRLPSSTSLRSALPHVVISA